MITLFHGSNLEITEISLDKGNPNKDFGKGFYLTSIKEQAEAMAIRKARIMGEGMPCVSAFSFDESCLENSELNCKVFTKPSIEWAEFILNNRNSSKTGFSHPYDIVIGPVADDGVTFQLDRYIQHLITLNQLVEELKYRKLNNQYYFGTELAISKLIKL